MKKVVITGAGGFIGYALAERLVNDDVEVYAVVRSAKKKMASLLSQKKFHIILCDLQNIDQLIDLVAERDFDVFYHFAWQGVSNEDSTSLEVQLDNVKATAKAVEIAKLLGCKKFVFASSIMEYELDCLMQTELFSGKRNIYRAAKKMATSVGRIYCNNSKIEYSVALVTNVYGPREFSNRFVISTLRKMLNNEKVCFSAATQLYDFCYIDDAVNILVLIGDKGKNNFTYYIGDAEPQPLRNYILTMKECVGGQSELVFDAGGEFIGVSLKYNEFDIYSTERELGYKRKVDFEDGINKTVQWIKNGGYSDGNKFV